MPRRPSSRVDTQLADRLSSGQVEELYRRALLAEREVLEERMRRASLIYAAAARTHLGKQETAPVGPGTVSTTSNRSGGPDGCSTECA